MGGRLAHPWHGPIVPLLALAAALAAAGCGGEPAAPPAPVAPVASPAPSEPPRDPAPPAPPAPAPSAVVAADVEWDPYDLRVRPDEIVPPPGTGRTRIRGRVVDEEGRPLPGVTVTLQALPMSSLPGFVPRTHCTTTSGPDGRFDAGPGPEPWPDRGMLVASLAGYANTALVSRRSTTRGWSADPGQDVEVVLRRGHVVRGRVRTRSGAPPDAPVTVWSIGALCFQEVVRGDAEGNFSLVAPEGGLTVSVVAAEHPGVVQRIHVSATEENSVDLEVLEGSDVTGRVLDAASGRPVEGAAIRGYYGESQVTVSDGDGRFRLPRYWYTVIQVRAPGYAEAMAVVPLPDATGVRRDLDVRLDPGVVVRGVVVDLDDRPLRGVRLWCHLKAERGGWMDLTGPRSDADGAFTFVGLPVTREPLELRIFGRQDMFAEGYSGPFTGEPGAVRDGARVVMRRLVRWQGLLRDEHGRPARGSVTLTWAFDPALQAYKGAIPLSIQLLARDGVFTAWVPERTPLGYIAESSLFATVQGEALSPAWSADRPVDDGPPDAVIEVRRGLSIRGRVVDSAGSPVTSGEIRFEPSPPSDPRRSADASIHRDGSFEAAGFEPGAYDFSVLGPDEFLQRVIRSVPAGGEDLTVPLRRKGGLAGRVLVPEGLPMGVRPRVRIRALEDPRPLPVTREFEITEGDGRFTVGPLAPVPHSVSIVAGEWRLDIPRVEVVERDSTELGELALRPGGRVRGVVTVAGSPAGGIRVEVYGTGDEGRRILLGTAVAGASGQYSVGGLEAGPVLVSVRPRDCPLVEGDVHVPEGGEVEVDLPVPEGGEIAVIAVDEAGEPVRGVRVVLSSQTGPLLYWEKGSPAAPPYETGDDGTLHCTGVAAGVVRVFGELPGRGTAELSVNVVSGRTVSARLVIAR